MSLLILHKSKTPSFLLQSNVVVLQSLAKHVIYQTLAPAGHCHRKIFLLILIANAKRCRSNLFKRHRFAIANFTYHLLIVMTSSLLLIASFRMYADVITAVSRFLSISNADVNVAAPDFTNPVPAGSTWPPPDFEHLT
ncbi:hypothetical protein F511_21522 [Dorcoceras hygrometricum]|uniref:Uncharacterized protein n=1 Tax=Dorcoceras hygrometricum TaxID=472368 RepID=A0A2Z7C6T1_9LAMI|nr:hypothetical protein F511_21522 [Dorcoceras hygrometricum]